MRLDTSHATSFDVQRNMLSEYLVSLCRARRVDITLAEKVIEALDALDARQFDTIQRSTLDEPSRRGNSYLDVCQHMSKAMRLYLAFIEKNKKNRKYVEKTKANRRMLDIGSGSGAFCFLSNALGHHAIGMDLPRTDKASAVLSSSYELTQWYHVDVIEHAIAPSKPLPLLERSLDDVVIFNPTFYKQWREQDWDFLFDELTKCVTKDESELYIKINTPKMKTAGGRATHTTSSSGRWSSETTG